MFEFSIHYSLLLHIILEDGFICVLHYMMLGPALARPDNAFTSGTWPDPEEAWTASQGGVMVQKVILCPG